MAIDLVISSTEYGSLLHTTSCDCEKVSPRRVAVSSLTDLVTTVYPEARPSDMDSLDEYLGDLDAAGCLNPEAVAALPVR